MQAYRKDTNMRSATIADDGGMIVAGDWLGRLHFLVVEREGDPSLAVRQERR
jgi:hypothetical protein